MGCASGSKRNRGLQQFEFSHDGEIKCKSKNKEGSQKVYIILAAYFVSLKLYANEFELITPFDKIINCQLMGQNVMERVK